MTKIFVSLLTKFPILGFMISHSPAKEMPRPRACKVQKPEIHHINSLADKYSNTTLAYFWAKTGPDFMHPIYTLGLERCLARVAPKVAAYYILNIKMWGNIAKNKTQRNNERKKLQLNFASICIKCLLAKPPLCLRLQDWKNWHKTQYKCLNSLMLPNLKLQSQVLKLQPSLPCT